MPRISVDVSPETIIDLDTWGENTNRSRSFVANQLIESAIREKKRKNVFKSDKSVSKLAKGLGINS